MMSDTPEIAEDLAARLEATLSKRKGYGNRAQDQLLRDTIAHLRRTTPPKVAGDAEEIAGRLEALLSGATPGPWEYRPEPYDDWGFIRGPKKQSDLIGAYRPIAAIARDSDVTSADMDAHRFAGTDPYQANGQLIVTAVNALPGLIAQARANASLAVEIEALREAVEIAETEHTEEAQRHLVTADKLELSEAARLAAERKLEAAVGVLTNLFGWAEGAEGRIDSEWGGMPGVEYEPTAEIEAARTFLAAINTGADDAE
jgi:hypothetical protein